MSDADTLQGFIFSELDIRGQVAGLGDAYLEALKGHDYPEGVARLIGEIMAAVALLSSNLKLSGTVSIQAQGDGPLNLLLAECRHNQEIRAVARCADEGDWDDLGSALGHGVLAITIDPDEGQRYQGVVPLEKPSLAGCLEDYFEQSEQLQTRIWLACDEGNAAGLMVQILPRVQSSKGGQDENWHRISRLTATLTPAELLMLENEILLYRLYNEEQVRVFPGAPLAYRCQCSRTRFLHAIESLGQAELETIFREQDTIVTHCEFCSREYHFTAHDLMGLDESEPSQTPPVPPTLH